MKYFEWDKGKNELLKRTRGIGFEDVIEAVNSGNLLETVDHPNKKKYPNQRMFIVNIKDYAYLVPFIEDEEKQFLKTIFPSRKAAKKYLSKKGKDK